MPECTSNFAHRKIIFPSVIDTVTSHNTWLVFSAIAIMVQHLKSVYEFYIIFLRRVSSESSHKRKLFGQGWGTQKRTASITRALQKKSCIYIPLFLVATNISPHFHLRVSINSIKLAEVFVHPLSNIIFMS